MANLKLHTAQQTKKKEKKQALQQLQNNLIQHPFHSDEIIKMVCPCNLLTQTPIGKPYVLLYHKRTLILIYISSKIDSNIFFFFLFLTRRFIQFLSNHIISNKAKTAHSTPPSIPTLHLKTLEIPQKALNMILGSPRKYCFIQQSPPCHWPLSTNRRTEFEKRKQQIGILNRSN